MRGTWVRGWFRTKPAWFGAAHPPRSLAYARDDRDFPFNLPTFQPFSLASFPRHLLPEKNHASNVPVRRVATELDELVVLVHLVEHAEGVVVPVRQRHGRARPVQDELAPLECDGRGAVAGALVGAGVGGEIV